MKKNTKKLIFAEFVLASLFVFPALAEPELAGYLQNDLELQRLALEVKKAELDSKQSKIEKGIDITLSTGQAKFKFNGDDTSVSFVPSVKLTAPQASNLAFSASSKITITNGTDRTSDTKLALSVDIISGYNAQRKNSLLEAEHNLLEAKRDLQNRALEAEKSYYTELKALFSSASEITSLQKDLYDDTISFEEVKAKGYTKNSAKYRQAEMRVISDQHDIETKIHSLEHDCAVFAKKCGTVFEDNTHPSNFLPKTIPTVEPISITDYKKEDYAKIESALYKHQIAELKRLAERDFTLTASGGYTFKNSNTKFEDSDSDPDTVDLGLEATFRGLTIGTEVNFPVNTVNPTYSVVATVNPNKFRTAKISEKQDELTEEEEFIAIKSAEDSYETDLVDKIQKLNDIKWTKQTYLETYDLYTTLADDLSKLLEQGIIKESEYLNAFANKEQYRLKLLMNDIDLIIYNNETKLLFCRDNEIE